MNFLLKIRDHNYDLPIYFLLVILYGLGWDLAADNTLELWSVVGVLSYTCFITLLMVRTRQGNDKPKNVGRSTKITHRFDFAAKIFLAAVLYGVLLYKLIHNVTLFK